jgi:hypothetical protein
MAALKPPKGGVISERNELHGHGWKDCTQSGGMMLYRDAGGKFPLKNLDQEREALERSDDWPDEQGAPIDAIIQAMNKRYHFSGHEVVDLGDQLDVPGTSIFVQGDNSKLPQRLKHWDPNFNGGHAGTIQVLGKYLLLWLDPEAPMGYPGDFITKAEVLRWAWGPKYARWAKWGELRPRKPKPVYYIVKAGETLSEIAASHHITLEKLKAFPQNKKQFGKAWSLIHPGDKVRVK